MGIQGRAGFIGGGKMGEALVKGLLGSGIMAAGQIGIFDSDAKRMEYMKNTYSVQIYGNNAELVKNSDIILLAVKPQIMDIVLSEIRALVSHNKLVISIAAGIPLAFMEGRLPEGTRIIRVMPNTPALIGEGAAALAGGNRVTPEDISLCKDMFCAVGKAVVVEEKYLDAVTGLSGSGPAYVFAFMEALVDAGVKLGLSREVSRVLTLQTVFGSAKMALSSGEHLSQLKEMVTSPGGTTIAGLHVMARAGFHGIVMDTVQTAADRSLELKKNVLEKKK